MRVLDASACVDLLLGTARGDGVRDAVRGQDLVAPSLVDVEVCSALARLERAGEVPSDRARAAVDDLGTMPLRRLHHDQLLDRAWALRHRVRVADTFYVACAQLLRIPLVTSDGRLSRAELPGVTMHLVR